MTSKTYLVEVAEDGTVIVGELRSVTRTITWVNPFTAHGATALGRIRVEGTIFSASATSHAEARVALVAGGIRAASS